MSTGNLFSVVAFIGGVVVLAIWLIAGQPYSERAGVFDLGAITGIWLAMLNEARRG